LGGRGWGDFDFDVEGVGRGVPPERGKGEGNMDRIMIETREIVYRVLCAEYSSIILRHIHEKRIRLTAYALRRMSTICQALVTISEGGPLLELPKIVQDRFGNVYDVRDLDFMLPFTYKKSTKE
jgi:hypothetical protein